jgi:hypothetical protein
LFPETLRAAHTGTETLTGQPEMVEQAFFFSLCHIIKVMAVGSMRKKLTNFDYKMPPRAAII